MGFFDDMFANGVNGANGATTQIVLTQGPSSKLDISTYGLSGNTRHSRHSRHFLPDHGEQVLILNKCGDCQHFERDQINPTEGLGYCQSFSSPYNPGKPLIRYPMQNLKNAACFLEGGTDEKRG